MPTYDTAIRMPDRLVFRSLIFCSGSCTRLPLALTPSRIAKGSALAVGKSGHAVSPTFRADAAFSTSVIPEIRLCRPGDPPPPDSSCPLLPRSRRRAGLQRSAALQRKPIGERP